MLDVYRVRGNGMTATDTITQLNASLAGHYAVEREIGVGGMSRVFLAHDLKHDRKVALKVLNPALGAVLGVERFLSEIKTTANLLHPHILPLFDSGSADGQLFYVMPFITGETLRTRLTRETQLSVADAVRLTCEVAHALEHAHTRGVVHRDVKPENILIQDGNALVADFGIALAVWKAGDDRLTEAGVSLGTPQYMSPEQAIGGRTIDGRSDVYSLGAVLYEMLAGEPPVTGPTAQAMIAKVLTERPTPLRLVRDAVPESIEAAVAKALAKTPADRFASAAEFAAALTTTGASSHGRTSASRSRTVRWLAAAGVLVAAGVAWAVAVPARRVFSAGERSASGALETVGQSQWVQLTRLAEPVSQPALSSDGRMLTFVRGPDTFLNVGEIFVKMLPDGEAVQLTNDGSRKMSPVFSPDNSQIAYTTGNGTGEWNTWVVPVNGGQSHLWLPNASGLVWSDKQRILFSEIKNGDIHMALVAAAESRAGARDVYVPAGDRDMVHRSYASPDGKWAIVVEMVRGVWQPCRAVSMNGNSPGRLVGPLGAGCTSAAWSPDGEWIYLNSAAGGAFHVWRQRFPDGRPEQVTAGPTEEEGIAMAPNGRSFVTAVGLRQSAVWVHDARGERQISVEGYGYDPEFTPDGRRLLYRILKGALATGDTSELRVLDVESGRNESFLPGVATIGLPGRAYDISPDGQLVVVATLYEGRRRLWLAPLDRRSSPRVIPNVEGDMPYFGSGGEIFFRGMDGPATFAYRVDQDGTGLRKVIERPIATINGISRDGQWLVTKFSGAAGASIEAVPLSGGSPVPITSGDASTAHLRWSGDGRSMFVSILAASLTSGRTYSIPLMPGRMLPPIPPGGFPSEAAIAKLRGVRLMGGPDVAPGPTPGVYAYSRQTVQRNLYRIPIP
jgi:Tol biopolymer transport system component